MVNVVISPNLERRMKFDEFVEFLAPAIRRQSKENVCLLPILFLCTQAEQMPCAAIIDITL